MNKKTLAALGILALGMQLPAAHAADDYPSHPVRVLVPVPAGGGVDTIARVVTTHLREELGQTFVVENKPGAGGNIGLGELAKAAPDGYTLAVVPNTLTINQTLMPNLPFDAVKSFAPVIQLGTSPVVMAGRGTLEAKTLKDLIAYAKAHPGKLTYAGCDTGSVQHLAGEMFKYLAKVDVTHVPYKGCADSIPNVLGGQVDLIFITYTNISSYLKDGRMRGYAIGAEQRLPYANDIPTGIEQGLQGYIVDAWYGVLAPAGTPQPVVDKLNAAFNKVLLRDDVKAALASTYITPAGGTPAQLAGKIRGNIDSYGKVARQANIKLD